MQIGLLGELEVRGDDGRAIAIPGAKLRALVALLALHVGRVVPVDQLIEDLWGDDAPAAVRNGLQGLVSKLRRVLGTPGIVAMRGEGYALELPADAVDVARFDATVAAGRAAVAAGDRLGGLELLTMASALWRGDALAEFAYDDFASTAITRLNEARLAVLEERLDLELQLGRHQQATAPLEELVAAQPLREGARGLLMLALYRAGRQADALRVFQDGRRLLGDELGLDPGPELRRLEAAILAQDPSLVATVEQAVPPAAPPSRRRIPGHLLPLLGRDADLRDVVALVLEQRLVTLVGPGGVGKTTLALAAARIVAEQLGGGGCVVELAPIGDPAGVAPALAAALGVTDPARVAEIIGDDDVLIVFDNCEHVIDEAAKAAEDLVRRCPGLRVLATSREGLRVVGETVWPVGPLAIDDAVRLFRDRSRAIGATLPVNDTHEAIVRDICVRLDGLPLAVELAAARTRAFPLNEIATRLDDRFRLLTGGSRTALPRQQTLRAVVEWSYSLLFDDERRVFERLSVLPGGFDLSTAETVCADAELDALDVADHVRALVEKSLVVALADQSRFTQLQTLAEYGRERLAQRGEAPQVRTAMAAHFARLCARSAEAYTSNIQREWLTAIDREHDNLRAALEWAVATSDAETALLIAGGAAWPHWLTGMVAEGRRWLADAFACGGEVTAWTGALALTGRGLLDVLAGDGERSDADLREAIGIFERLGDRDALALAQSFYAEQAITSSDLAEARRRREAVIDFHTALSDDDPFARACRAYSLAKLAVLDGDLREAEIQYRSATDGFATMDRPVMSSMCLGMVADFDERAGDYRAAAVALEAAIATNEALLGGFTGSLTARLAWVLLMDGQLSRSEAAYRSALASARRVRHAMVLFQAQAGLAALHLVAGRADDARASAQEAIELYRTGGFRRFRNRIDPTSDLLSAAALSSEVLAIDAAACGELALAAQLLGEADALRVASGIATPPLLVDALAATRASLEMTAPVVARERAAPAT